MLKELFDLDAKELEAHIRDCGALVHGYMNRYAKSNNEADRIEADFWRVNMETAIKARAPETVARMEEQRGLA